MDAAWLALAEAARPPLWDPRLLWLTLALVAVILLGVLILVWVDRWRKRSDTERLSANDQLANFRELYEQGQLSAEEFEQVRAFCRSNYVNRWMCRSRPIVLQRAEVRNAKPAEQALRLPKTVLSRHGSASRNRRAAIRFLPQPWTKLLA